MMESPILITILIAILLALVPERRKGTLTALAAIGALYGLFAGVQNFVAPYSSSLSGFFTHTPFSALIGLSAAFFAAIIVMFSLKQDIKGRSRFYSHIFAAVGLLLAVVYSANLIVLSVFWVLTSTIIRRAAKATTDENTPRRDSLMIFSDVCMVSGVIFTAIAARTFDLSRVQLLVGGSLMNFIAFSLVLAAALTKAGAIPFHGWIPDFSKTAAMPASAFFPFSIAPLLGIFLLVVASQQWFVLGNGAMLILMCVGALTILLGVTMALMQHDMKTLLSFDSISQVGYVVLGIGSGTALGLAGSVFHLINNALFQNGLFLTGASVKAKSGHTDLDALGGIGRFMPLTFAAALVFSLSIAGIPPLNGFVSKWMIFQGLLQQSINNGTPFLLRLAFVVFLLVALLGSALTMASFMKLLFSVYLGQAPGTDENMKRKFSEVPASLWLPTSLLALACVALGVFAVPLALKGLIYPALSRFLVEPPSFFGLWQPGTAAILMLFGILGGMTAFFLARKTRRYDSAFTGGEQLNPRERINGSGFYQSILAMGFFRALLALYSAGTSVEKLFSRNK